MDFNPEYENLKSIQIPLLMGNHFQLLSEVIIEKVYCFCVEAVHDEESPYRNLKISAKF